MTEKKAVFLTKIYQYHSRHGAQCCHQDRESHISSEMAFKDVSISLLLSVEEFGTQEFFDCTYRAMYVTMLLAVPVSQRKHKLDTNVESE